MAKHNEPSNETSLFPETVYKALLEKFEVELNTELKGYYVWPFPLNSLSGMELAECDKIKKALAKFKDNPARLTLEAKSRFSKILSKQDDETYLKIAKWIVGEWGKINSVPKEDSLNELRNTIKDKKNNSDDYAGVIGFDGISSLSKVASFLDSEKYPVYDSRVAFTLNWLIFTNGWHTIDGGEMMFFRQPAARNGDMDIHDQETIFNLAYKNFAVDKFYYSKRETYERYCQLLKGTYDYSKKCRNKGISIGELEMFLFAIAAKNKKSKAPCKCIKYITDEMDEKLKPSLIKPLCQLHPLRQLRSK